MLIFPTKGSVSVWTISNTCNLENIRSVNDKEWIVFYINVTVYAYCNEIHVYVCVCVYVCVFVCI